MRRFVFVHVPLSTLLLFSMTLWAFGQGAPDRLSIPSNKVRISGINVHFVEAGKGPPLLFLHGLGGAWRDWSANLPAFAATYRVIAMDFPGFRESDKPEVQYSIEWLTDVVEKFLQEQDIDRVNLVGHSMGGVVALNVASRPKSRVKKLVITDAVGIGDKSEFLGYAMCKKIMGADTEWESMESFLKNQFRRLGSRVQPLTDFFVAQAVEVEPFERLSICPIERQQGCIQTPLQHRLRLDSLTSL